MTNKATMGRSLSSSVLWALRNTRRRAGGGGGASFLGSQEQQQQQLSSLTSAQRDVTDRKDLLLLSAHRQSFSSTASSLSTSDPSSSFVVDDDDDLDDGPWGDLFGAEVGYGLVGKRAWIHRSFGARANSDAMLTCGGSDLAKHASFDPSYDRARSWIRHHAVGPAVLSPILINGLVGALVEASVPHSVPMSSSIQHKRPLIVGVEVCAKVEVVEVKDPAKEQTLADSSSLKDDDDDDHHHNDTYERKKGYAVTLKTEVSRLRDGAVIANGTHEIWIPDYLHF